MFKAHACYLSASRTPVQVSLVFRRISRVGHAYQIIAFAVSRARKVHPIARTCFLRRQGSVKAHARIKKNKSKNTKKRKKEKKKQEKAKKEKSKEKLTKKRRLGIESEVQSKLDRRSAQNH